MELTVYNQEGKKIGMDSVPETLFGLKMNSALVYQVFTVKLANKRRPYAHTKTRADVRGGGIKPWQQKGTGKARHGSIRSPLWVGGGVTFGPRSDRTFSKNINKKMNRKAIAILFSAKAQDKSIFVIDSLKFTEAKTKFGAKLLDALNKERKSTLVIGSVDDKNFRRTFNNIPHSNPISVNRINVLDILNNKNCVISRNALKSLINTYKKEESTKSTSPAKKKIPVSATLKKKVAKK